MEKSLIFHIFLCSRHPKRLIYILGDLSLNFGTVKVHCMSFSLFYCCAPWDWPKIISTAIFINYLCNIKMILKEKSGGFIIIMFSSYWCFHYYSAILICVGRGKLEFLCHLDWSTRIWFKDLCWPKVSLGVCPDSNYGHLNTHSTPNNEPSMRDRFRAREHWPVTSAMGKFPPSHDSYHLYINLQRVVNLHRKGGFILWDLRMFIICSDNVHSICFTALIQHRYIKCG